MNAISFLDNFIKENNGCLIVTAATSIGISRQVIYSYIKKRNLERVSSGIYVTNETFPDPMYSISQNNQKAVFSYESSLYLHKLTQREPSAFTVTVPYGYNASHLKKQNIKIVTAVSEYYKLGQEYVKTVFGNEVKAFDTERTICDIIRSKNKIDVQVFQYALREYMKSPQKRLPVLSEYASALGISEKVRLYTEILYD